MKIHKFLLVPVLLTCLFLTGCNRSGGDVWDDTRSAGRHFSRGIRSIGGKCGDSRQVGSRDEFYCADEYPIDGSYQVEEYTPFPDQDACGEIAMGDGYSPPPREHPGEQGSSIPGIEAFRDPATIPGLSRVFQNIHFEYNSNLVKGQENLQVVHQIADYLRSNNNVYIFVEGHCDERGPESYNLALGSRRSNEVRNLLIKEGISPDRIFTVSYGKERPLTYVNNEEGWSLNRRAEFKVYFR